MNEKRGNLENKLHLAWKRRTKLQIGLSKFWIFRIISHEGNVSGTKNNQVYHVCDNIRDKKRNKKTFKYNSFIFKELNFQKPYNL